MRFTRAATGAFNDPLDPVKASKAIQDHLHDRRADTLARLRISLDTGPCIAVRLDSDLGYFGHTVDVAAYLQALAECWQVALSDSTYGARGVAEWLAQQGAPLEDVAYSSAAISEPIPGNLWTVYR